MVHTLFLTDLQNFNPVKYMAYTVILLLPKSWTYLYLKQHVAKNFKEANSGWGINNIYN